jgi:ribosome assembly protein YihI (activator of Der GTPase)
MSAQEYFEVLMTRHTKIQARAIIESKLSQLDAKMNKYGFTPDDLAEERLLKETKKLIIEK